ncbi:MAG: argininosuccinate synthase [Candidatus Helarchaeota archaeon]
MYKANFQPDLEELKGKPVVLLYSGGLDTSVMLKWIQEKYDCSLISLTLSIGQRGKDFKKIEEKAKKLGVKKHFTIDAKKEFLEDYVFPAIKANALYEGTYPLHSALSRPLLAKWAIKVAKQEGAVAIAHGCTGKGNDQVRITVTAYTLEPDIKVIQPVVEWGFTREEEIEYATKHGIIIPKQSKYSIDENLWGRSIECSDLEHPEIEPNEDAFEWTRDPKNAPDEVEYITIEFERGMPVGINGEKMDGVELVQKLNDIGGKHGIGRLDHLEDRIVGIKSREIYENPAAVLLITAHKDLEKSICTTQEFAFKSIVDEKWADLVYSALWVDPLREDLDIFIDKVNERVNGEVHLKLYKGNAQIVGRKSDWALYDYNLATYEKISTFNEKASAGFMELYGLQVKLANMIKKKNKK